MSYVFMLTKGGDYFCDQTAASEKNTPGSEKRLQGAPIRFAGPKLREAGLRAGPNTKTVFGRNPRNFLLLSHEPMDWQLCKSCKAPYSGRDHKRLSKISGKAVCKCGASDWLSHYAAYPPTLVWHLLKAAVSKGGCCPTCGAQCAPVIESEKLRRKRPNDFVKRSGADGTGNFIPQTTFGVAYKVLEYRPTCNCPLAASVPPRVLDPFSGSGSTGLAANYLGAGYTGIELNEDYALMSAARLAAGWKPRHKRPKNKQPVEVVAGQKNLFG